MKKKYVHLHVRGGKSEGKMDSPDIILEMLPCSGYKLKYIHFKMNKNVTSPDEVKLSLTYPPPQKNDGRA